MVDRRPTRVFAGPLVEAQRAWSALNGHGIRAELLEQHVGAAYGFPWVQVVVPAWQEEAATELLGKYGLAKGPAEEPAP